MQLSGNPHTVTGPLSPAHTHLEDGAGASTALTRTHTHTPGARAQKGMGSTAPGGLNRTGPGRLAHGGEAEFRPQPQDNGKL